MNLTTITEEQTAALIELIREIQDNDLTMDDHFAQLMIESFVNDTVQKTRMTIANHINTL